MDCLNIDLAEIISNFASASLELIILNLKNKVGLSFVFNGQTHFSFADSQECETCASARAVLRFMTYVYTCFPGTHLKVAIVLRCNGNVSIYYLGPLSSMMCSYFSNDTNTNFMLLRNC